MAILIGLTGWSDHEDLFVNTKSARDKLTTYSSHFPIVEVDTAFYAIQPQKNYEQWVEKTPNNFSFVIKAYKTMTGHDRVSLNNLEAKQLFDEYRNSIQPVLEANKLNCILFQFPPWFDVRQSHIKKLKKIKRLLPNLPLALEFRNQTWFQPQYKNETLHFMREEGWIHSICDEPQAGEGSVPTVLEVTNPENTIIRFHGRNVHGWNRNGRDDWRAVRFLYDYNKEELAEWAINIRKIGDESKNISILFNNNSGGHAAGNAKQLIDLLNISYKDLHPRQMNLFEQGR